MSYHEYLPTEKLRPFVKAFRIIESDFESTNRVLPSTSLGIAFRFKGQISYVNEKDKTILPATTFSGLQKSVRLINYAADTASLIVLFTETGAAAFVRHPLYELFGESISGDIFFANSEIGLIEEQISEASSHSIRTGIVEKFLLSKLAFKESDRIVETAILKIHQSKGLLKMKALADSLYISQDAFEKKFRKLTGATPKQFSLIVRMNTIIKQKAIQSSFIDKALDSGFYDQAHFNKVFKNFTGQTPTDFFKSPLYW